MLNVDDLLSGIFGEKLLSSGKRLIPSVKPPKIRLDRNESSFEVTASVKSKVIKHLEETEWKNYPPPYYNKLEGLIAGYSGVQKEQVVPGAGSANIITSLLNYFAINNKPIVLAQPSFSLYEYHCNTYGIQFDTWKLSNELEYDINLLPHVKPYSLVLFASPNNPVGNIISASILRKILSMNPESLFLVDEVYHEFSEENLTDLLKEYPNLLLLRSFSKSFSAAGLRIGYLIANEKLATNIRKLIIPFVLNYLSIHFVESILSDPDVIKENKKNIKKTIQERNRVSGELLALDKNSDKYLLRPSFANFILVQFKDELVFEKLNKVLEQEEIKLLDLSNVPMLGKSLRITIGKTVENDAVIEAFNQVCA